MIEGIADLGVPTILFGVGTGELLGLMATAGADVIGVDWRVPLDVARSRVGPDHAVQGNLDPALCVAPWPVVEAAARQVMADGAADGSGTGHIFNLGHGVLPEADIGILGGRGRPGARGERTRMTTATAPAPIGVLVMAHGTPSRRQDIAPFYTRIRRGRPPSPEQLAELEGRYAAIGGLSPLTERTQAQVDGVRAELERRAPGRYVVAYGAKHAAPLIEEAAAALAGAGVRAGHRSRAHPARLVHGLAGVPGAGRDGDRRDVSLHRRAPLVRRAGPGGAAGGAGDRRPRRPGRSGERPEPVPGDLHRPLAARRASGTSGDTYPEQLEESARLVADGGRPGALAGGLAERRPHARALARSRHTRRGAPAGATRAGATGSWSAPSVS